jgi:hypothetical protein
MPADVVTGTARMQPIRQSAGSILRTVHLPGGVGYTLAMPAFFPFLLVAAAVIALGTGQRTGWRTSAEMAEEERKAREAKTAPWTPEPVVKGAPVRHWFYWYLHYQGRVTPYGPILMTDQEAFQNEFRTKSQFLGVDCHRYVWDARGQKYLRDTRSPPQFLASEPIPGMTVGELKAIVYPFEEITGIGAVRVSPPVRGRWRSSGYPESVTVDGRMYRKAQWKWPKPGVVAQYREAVRDNSHHLYVLADGTYVINHYDEANPDQGLAFEHLVRDVLKPMGAPRRAWA